MFSVVSNFVSVCQHNSWTLGDIIAKFSRHHTGVERADQFENGCIEVRGWWFSVFDVLGLPFVFSIVPSNCYIFLAYIQAFFKLPKQQTVIRLLYYTVEIFKQSKIYAVIVTIVFATLMKFLHHLLISQWKTTWAWSPYKFKDKKQVACSGSANRAMPMPQNNENYGRRPKLFLKLLIVLDANKVLSKLSIPYILF